MADDNEGEEKGGHLMMVNLPLKVPLSTRNEVHDENLRDESCLQVPCFWQDDWMLQA